MYSLSLSLPPSFSLQSPFLSHPFTTRGSLAALALVLASFKFPEYKFIKPIVKPTLNATTSPRSLANQVLVPVPAPNQTRQREVQDLVPFPAFLLTYTPVTHLKPQVKCAQCIKYEVPACSTVSRPSHQDRNLERSVILKTFVKSAKQPLRQSIPVGASSSVSGVKSTISSSPQARDLPV
ncbi:hypothetical protein FB45DRAFT_962925 [Roridomyces roridus]|uniref:Uncharacterized protein n=1 Tax=Roridomyces roridus TaxID=1738132 RepID=A0AAD7AXI4_9AGAR|nr:hypothetical protein FB45DRAFT_962925 [Roridomyces roridus]